MAQMELDMQNRDPNNLNNHVQVAWEDVFGEPEGIRSMDCVWKNAYSCFECWKGCCYKLMTFCCGICIAAEWGCEFAMLAFNHVWCWTPCMRDCSITLGFWQKCLGICINCCLSPLCEALGMCLSKIKITKG